ncbi:MAG: hypothetical protein K5739_00615 [Lachnospiraceae bacterium]|nr:hypothetical protein [Lachnospiraceae bacterium]
MVSNTKMVILISCLASLLVSCRTVGDNETANKRIADQFHVECEPNDLQVIYNDYEGVPYEGTALYLVSVGENSNTYFEEWENAPFSGEVNDYLESITDYVQIPEMKNYKWKMINRNARSKILTDVSLGVYDIDTKKLYVIESDS